MLIKLKIIRIVVDYLTNQSLVDKSFVAAALVRL